MELRYVDFVRRASPFALLLTALTATSARAQNPSDAALHYHLAQEARRNGDVARAAEWLASAVQLDSEAVLPRLEWAGALLDLGDGPATERAIEPLGPWWEARLAAHTGGSEDVLAARYAHLRAATAGRRNDDNAAVAWYERAAAMAPGDLGLHAQLIGLYRTRQDEEGAYTHLSAVAGLMPANAEVRLEMGRSLLSLERWVEAERVFAEATLLDPRLERGWDGLGIARSRRGDLPGARDAFRRGLEVAPASATIYEHLGDALLGSGRVEAALDAYRRAASLAPHETRLAEKVDRTQAALPR